MTTQTIREHLEKHLIGQEHVISSILTPITRYNTGFTRQDRPAGIYLLLGPTGTGKTLTTELVAEAMHGSKAYVLRVNCAEFQHSHEVAKLIGSPPGYLGHRETKPMLCDSVLGSKRTPTCPLVVILFDEIEKADDAVYKLLLGILDKAELRTGDNQLVQFQNTLIFMTSNLGTREIASKKYSFVNESEKRERVRTAEQAAKRHFSPEFLNRVDSVITYNQLERGHIEQIVGSYIAGTNTLMRERVDGKGRLQLAVSDEATGWLAKEGYSTEYGARELRRVWEREVETPLAEFVGACGGTNRNWPVVRLDVEGERLEFTPLTLEETLGESLRNEERLRERDRKTERLVTAIFGGRV